MSSSNGDLVERLRDQADEVLDPGYPFFGTPELVREAADEIERLRARLDEAERLLRKVGTPKFSYGEIDAFLAGEKP